MTNLKPVDQTPIVDEASFMAAFEIMKENARALFDEDGYHSHLIFMIKPDGHIVPAVFDEHCKLAEQALKGAQKAGVAPKDINLEQTAKELVYGGLAAFIEAEKVVGFFEVTEGWTLVLDGQDTMTAQNFGEGIHDYLEKNGYKNIRDVPTRGEVLLISARWKDKAYHVQWKIGRTTHGVWLEDFQQNDVHGHKEDTSKQSMIHRAIEKVLESAS